MPNRDKNKTQRGGGRRRVTLGRNYHDPAKGGMRGRRARAAASR